MQDPRTRTLLVVLIISAGVAVGAVRDFLTVNLNYQLQAVSQGWTISYAHSLFQGWVDGWDVPALLRLKWALAIVFVSLMAAGAVLLARILWGDHRYRRPILLAFAVLALLALLLHLLAALHPGFGLVGVKVLHSLQYPMVLVLLWAASWVGRSSRS